MSWKSVPSTFTIIFDLWTDQHAKLPYIDVSIHFFDNNFNIFNRDLTLELFEHPHTGHAIKNKIEDVLKRYGLQTKRFWTVTDNGSNVKLAGLLMDNCAGSHFCINHTIHLILMYDLLVKGHFQKLKNIMKKLKNTHKSLVYKKQEIKNLFFEELNKKVLESMEAFLQDSGKKKLEKNLLSEIYKFHSFSDDVEGITKMWPDETESFESFKNSNVTRWLSTKKMVDSYLKNKGMPKVNNYNYIKKSLSNELQMGLKNC